ncbi:unnamed protein product, partial [Ectocarpus sp. 13 AM-2016]
LQTIGIFRSSPRKSLLPPMEPLHSRWCTPLRLSEQWRPAMLFWPTRTWETGCSKLRASARCPGSWRNTARLLRSGQPRLQCSHSGWRPVA